MSCLIVASLESTYLQSEVQELVVCLQKAGYEVNLLQTGVTSLELYRSLNTFPSKKLRLVWVAGHAETRGFRFGDVLITPHEFGLFLNQGKVKEAVFNTCFSMEHVSLIQRHASVNIVATVNAEIEDKEAWTNAIYLGRKLAESTSLVEAYQAMLSDGNSGYRWFPAPRVERLATVYTDEEEDELKEIRDTVNRLELITARLVRALQGDSFIRQNGILDILKDLEVRIEALENEKRNENKLSLKRSDAIVIIIIFLLLGGGIVYLTYILGGYHFNVFTEFKFTPADTRLFIAIFYKLLGISEN